MRREGATGKEDRREGGISRGLPENVKHELILRNYGLGLRSRSTVIKSLLTIFTASDSRARVKLRASRDTKT